jgi:thiamine biosynthesis protein ThiS
VIIKINGTELEVNKATTLLGIVQEKGLFPERIVVEHNMNIVPRECLGDIIVADNDSIEIVSFVGGG